MKKSFLILPAMIALFSFYENNNDCLNKVSSNEYVLDQQDPPEENKPGSIAFLGGPME